MAASSASSRELAASAAVLCMAPPSNHRARYAPADHRGGRRSRLASGGSDGSGGRWPSTGGSLCHPVGLQSFAHTHPHSRGLTRPRRASPSAARLPPRVALLYLVAYQCAQDCRGRPQNCCRLSNAPCRPAEAAPEPIAAPKKLQLYSKAHPIREITSLSHASRRAPRCHAPSPSRLLVPSAGGAFHSPRTASQACHHNKNRSQAAEPPRHSLCKLQHLLHQRRRRLPLLQQPFQVRSLRCRTACCLLILPARNLGQLLQVRRHLALLLLRRHQQLRAVCGHKGDRRSKSVWQLVGRATEGHPLLPNQHSTTPRCWPAPSPAGPAAAHLP